MFHWLDILQNINHQKYYDNVILRLLDVLNVNQLAAHTCILSGCHFAVVVV